MRKLKKAVLSVAAFAMSLGFCVSAFAEDTVINFRYQSSEYDNHVISIWEDGGTGVDYQFVADGENSIYTYTVANPEAEVVSFYVKDKDGNPDVNVNRSVDIPENGGIIDVIITPQVEAVQIQEGTAVVEETTAAIQEETTVAAADTTATTTETTVAAKPVGDDPDADYSFSTIAVILIDIVLLAAVAGISYFVMNKKKF